MPAKIMGHSVAACVANGAGVELGPELGRGEQGVAYSIKKDDNYVIKSTRLRTDADAKTWTRESCYSKEIGDLGIAPRIHKYFICNGIGYIVMDRLVTIKGAYPDVREKIPDENGDYSIVDHVSLLPLDVQRGFVNACATLINSGFIHMDNHFDNVGFLLNARPILFDFGFTQKRDFSGPNDYEWALAFSLFQFLEHAPLEEIEETIFFQVINSIFSDALEGPSEEGSIASFTSSDVFRPLKNKREFNARLQTFKMLACQGSNDPRNADIALGTLCYAMLVQMDQEDRYDSPFYDVVYEVRTGKIEPIDCM